MTDHVSNLRSNALEWEDSQCSQRSKWASEAADEIERLRSTIQLDKWVLQEAADEIERLTKSNTILRAALDEIATGDRRPPSNWLDHSTNPADYAPAGRGSGPLRNTDPGRGRWM